MAPDGSTLVAATKSTFGLVAVRHVPDATGQTGGTWASQDIYQGSPGIVMMGMDATGNAVLAWKTLTDVTGNPPLRFKRFSTSTGWGATGTVPDIDQSPSLELSVGPDGHAIVLTSFGRLLRAVRLP
jgi:hypothetical protein